MTVYTSEQTGPDYIASMPESEALSTIEKYSGTPRKDWGIAAEHPLSLYPSGVENKYLCRIAGTSCPEFKPLSIDPENPNDETMMKLTDKGFRMIHLPGGAMHLPRRIYYVDPLRRLAYIVPISEEGTIDRNFLKEFFSFFTARSGHQESLLALWNLCKFEKSQYSSFSQIFESVMQKRKMFKDCAKATVFVFLERQQYSFSSVLEQQVGKLRFRSHVFLHHRP